MFKFCSYLLIDGRQNEYVCIFIKYPKSKNSYKKVTLLYDSSSK